MSSKLKYVVRVCHYTYNDDNEISNESSRTARFATYEVAQVSYEIEKCVISHYSDSFENTESRVYLEYIANDIATTLEFAEAFGGNFK